MTIPNQAVDSSQSGFLQPLPPPAGPAPVEGQPLEDYLQQFVAGVAGLDGTMVRPRWQPEPPNLPDFGVDWCATGITRKRPIGFTGYVEHHPDSLAFTLDDAANPDVTGLDAGVWAAGPGYDELQRHEEFELMCSFYGKNAEVFAENLHSGLMIWQNTAALRLVGLAFVEALESIRVPELIKQRWWNRVDKTLVLRRIIQRFYPVLNIISAPGQVNASDSDASNTFATYVTPFNAH